jgi:hypothetical protein
MKPKITQSELVNWWLEKYHGVTVEQVREEHPDWTYRDFFPAYQVTQEQHDEWYEWAITTIMKRYRYSKRRAKREFTFPYLNVAPSVKEES